MCFIISFSRGDVSSCYASARRHKYAQRVPANKNTQSMLYWMITSVRCWLGRFSFAVVFPYYAIQISLLGFHSHNYAISYTYKLQAICIIHVIRQIKTTNTTENYKQIFQDAQ